MNKIKQQYILFQSLFGLLLWIPIFYEFQKQIGLSDPQIFQIQSIYYLAFILFEIPTGHLADRFGYKSCLVSGAAFLSLANLLPLLSANFIGMLAHFLLIAASRALISGAASALLFESLKKINCQDHYKEIEGSARSYSLVAKVIGWTGVGYLMSWSLFSPYLLTGIFSLCALFVAIKIETEQHITPHPNQPVERPSFFQGIVNASLGLAKNHRLLLIMLQGTGIFVLVRVIQVNLFQPILLDKQIPIAYFGWIMAIMTLCEALGSRNAYKLQSSFDDKNAVTTLTVAICILVAFVSFDVGSPICIILLCVFSLLVGFAFPIQRQLLNDHILDTEKRATLLSFDSIISRGLCSIAVLPMGGLIGKNMLNEALLGSAVGVLTIIIATNILFAFNSERKFKNAKI